MRLPDWLRAGRPRRTGPRTVTVTLTADTTALVTQLDRAAEGIRVMRYRERIAHERSIGLTSVGRQLDVMCRDLGMDPVQTWRLPRHREEQARRDQAALRLMARAAVTVQPSRAVWGGDVA